MYTKPWSAGAGGEPVRPWRWLGGAKGRRGGAQRQEPTTLRPPQPALPSLFPPLSSASLSFLLLSPPQPPSPILLLSPPPRHAGYRAAGAHLPAGREGLHAVPAGLRGGPPPPSLRPA